MLWLSLTPGTTLNPPRTIGPAGRTQIDSIATRHRAAGVEPSGPALSESHRLSGRSKQAVRPLSGLCTGGCSSVLPATAAPTHEASGTISHPCKKQSDKAACKCRSCDNESRTAWSRLRQSACPICHSISIPPCLRPWPSCFLLGRRRTNGSARILISGSQPSAPGSSID